MPQSKAFDLVVNQPAGPLFDPTAQMMVACGILLFLFMWGLAKILKAGK